MYPIQRLAKPILIPLAVVTVFALLSRLLSPFSSGLAILVGLMVLSAGWFCGWLLEHTDNEGETEKVLWLLIPLGLILFLAGDKHRIAGFVFMLCVIPLEALFKSTQISAETKRKHDKQAWLTILGAVMRRTARGSLLLFLALVMGSMAVWAGVSR